MQQRNQLVSNNLDLRNSFFSPETNLWTTNINFASQQNALIVVKYLEKVKEKNLYIGAQYIKYSRHKYISFIEAFLTILRNSNDEIVGFRLEKNGNKIEFFGQIKGWLAILMKECISLDFVSNFQIVKLLGSGSAANVYKVNSKIDNQDYAIKVFDKSLSYKDSTIQQSIKMEIKILRQLNHPNIIQYKGVFESNAQIILVQELLEGGDLKNILGDEIVNEGAAKQILRSILKGLSYMHNKGIFHRDIKKCNLMLRTQDNFNSLCIIDFGLAEKANDDNNYLFKYCGTPGCVAPEILRKQKYGLKVDIYSVGILGYQILFGKDPYQSASAKETILKNFLGHIDFLNIPQISNNGLCFIKSLLQDDPINRLSAKQALKHPFLYNEENQLITRNYLDVNRTKAISPKLKPLIFKNSRNSSPNGSPKIQPNKVYFRAQASPLRKNTEQKEKISNSENYGKLTSSWNFRNTFKKMNTK
ncbi:unnamed protein product [Paramecium pentaurelia]|uniref:Protein kinase domain-containing protein n=1 Tax=Paramecium pentaurelia TaxID=43138 RepID=A0A8S1TIP8_9CILI|nr:unnamed protein product [Paramecium pentaurelia]